ncbi:MAG: ATPase, T2SS/T4P/T4SS family, partial [Phycisphaerales bacterium JB037]
VGLTLAAGAVLVSWWKALILLVPFVVWAWIISDVYDKHAARFHLGRKKWNLIQLVIGVAAAAGAFVVPVLAGVGGIAGFGIALGAVVLILGIGIGAYPFVSGKDARVPPDHRVKIDFSKFAEKRKAKAEKKQAGKAELVILRPDKSKVLVPDAETPEFEVRTASEGVVMRAREARASQLDILPTGKDGSYGVTYLVDGVRQTGEGPMPAQDAVRIIDFWKDAGLLDVADRRKKQTADIRIAKGEENYTARLTTIGGQGGQRLTMLFDHAQAVRRSPENLGMLEPQLQELRELVKENRGTVVLAAPSDGGRTTLFYTIVKMHDAYTSNVQTIELQTEDSLEGVRQNVFDPNGEQEFGKLVRSILRRDPRVVAVADLDADAAKEMARADHERTRTYASFKTDGVLGAVQLWVKAVGDLEQAGEALHGGVAGKLVRRLCENCRVAYQPSADMLKKLGLPADKVKQLYKKGGQVLIKNKPEVCPVCAGNGYAGQVGVFEVYRFGPEERDAIKKGDLNALRAALRKRGLPSLQQAALRAAVEGVTSVEEVLRVTTESGKTGSTGTKTATAAT